MSLWDKLLGLFSGGSGGGFNALDRSVSDFDFGPVSSYEPMTRPGIDWGGGFKDFAKEIAPGIGSALVGGAANFLFPGTPARIIGMDPRTSNMSQAETTRLGTASMAQSRLAAALRGELDPYTEKQVRARSRNADAARGMLETGGSAEREREAIQAALQEEIKSGFGNVDKFTSGYTPLSIAQTPASENPWSKLIGASVAPAAGKAIKAGLQKWWV